jgi:hypothetical protein
VIIQERFAYRADDHPLLVLSAALNWFWSRLDFDPFEPDEYPEMPYNRRTLEETRVSIVRAGEMTLVPGYCFAVVEIDVPPWIDEDNMMPESASA